MTVKSGQWTVDSGQWTVNGEKRERMNARTSVTEVIQGQYRGDIWRQISAGSAAGEVYLGAGGRPGGDVFDCGKRAGTANGR
ncbi:MAG: hypothetical protein M5U34_33085 [Chloroflexi bacterium]|nr:hypothetical protein [Chloroflexota bacterium]